MSANMLNLNWSILRQKRKIFRQLWMEVGKIAFGLSDINIKEYIRNGLVFWFDIGLADLVDKAVLD
jgi:hypothetical protein